MKQRSKKIIAREFLFLLGTSIFYFLLLFIWSSIKDSNQLKQLEIKNNIEQLTSYEKLPYRLRTFYYINNDIIKNHYNKMTDSKKFISVIKDYDEAEKIYLYIKEKGTIGIDKSEFFKRITEDKESENYLTKILPLEKELSKLESSFLMIWMMIKPLLY